MTIEAIQDRLLSVRDTAKLLGCSSRQIHRLRSSHRICPDLRIGGSVRFRLSTLTEWLNMSCPSQQEFIARKESENA